MTINGQPFTSFDAFVRHGGYVASVCRAVEDRIAGTVVVKK